MLKQAKLKDYFMKQNRSNEQDCYEAEIPEAAADDAVPPSKKKKEISVVPGRMER